MNSKGIEVLAACGGSRAVPTGSLTPWPAPDGADLSALTKVVKSGRFHRVNHPIVEELEGVGARWCAGQRCRALSSGTAALHVALDFYKNRGRRVVLSALNWPGAAGPIALCGYEPVFVDINLNDACMSDEVDYSSLGTDTAAFLVTHLFGNFAGVPSIRSQAATHDIAIVDDCAQAIGAPKALCTSERRENGAIALSGNGSKHLGAGELGLLCSDQASLIDHVDVVSLSSSSRHAGREFSPLTHGYNYRPNVFSASVALHRFAALDQQLAARRQNVERLSSRLSALTGLKLFYRPGQPMNSFCSLPLRIEPAEMGLPDGPKTRDEIVRLLAAEGVPASVWLKKPVWDYIPSWQGRFELTALPNTARALATMFHITEIAPPNGSTEMDLIAEAFEKVWDVLPALRNGWRERVGAPA